MLPYQAHLPSSIIHSQLPVGLTGSVTPSHSRTLYVGDLSVYCTEKDLGQVFSTFGPVESVHIRRATAQIAYGFVRFKHRASAEAALASMQSTILMGRPLRLGWAEDTRNLNPQSLDGPSMRLPSVTVSSTPYSGVAATTTSSIPIMHAQIHVAFLSNHLKIVTESFLRLVFERFGQVVDVSIKKLHVSKETGQQSGYGFVHYSLDETGIASAIRAVTEMNERNVESIFFRCSYSHGLSKMLKETGINPSMVHNQLHPVTANSLQTTANLARGISSAHYLPASSNFYTEYNQPLMKNSGLDNPSFFAESGYCPSNRDLYTYESSSFAGNASSIIGRRSHSGSFSPRESNSSVGAPSLTSLLPSPTQDDTHLISGDLLRYI